MQNTQEFDYLLQRVIEESLKDEQKEMLIKTFSSSINPNDLLRDENVPVGLSNVGNSCFINALLQVYFMIPKFRMEILRSYPEKKMWKELKKKEPSLEKAFPYYPLILELQELFAFLILSNKKYFNPINTLKKIFEIQNTSLALGNQEDITEFNHLFCEAVSKAHSDMAIKKSNQNQESKKQIEELLFGKEFHKIEGKKVKDGKRFMRIHEPSFGQIILNLNSNDLYLSLNQYVKRVPIDFKLDDEETKDSTQQILFEKLPPILTFQLQRVQYDFVKNKAIKNNTPFHFDKIIYMDRYLHSKNDDLAKSVNKTSDEEIAKRNKEIQQLINYKESGKSVVEILNLAIDFLENQEEKPDKKTIEELTQKRDQNQRKIKELERERDLLKKAENMPFQNMREHPYALFAVVIHSGLAMSGHYYSYINDIRTEKWWKFNDRIVSQVSEKQVFEEGIGDGVSKGAYCLFYHKISIHKKSQKIIQNLSDKSSVFFLPKNYDYIPQELKSTVEKENKNLEDEIFEFNLVKDSQISRKIKEFKTQISHRFKQIETENSQKNETDDPFLKSFIHFVISKKHFSYAKFLIAKQISPEFIDSKNKEKGLETLVKKEMNNLYDLKQGEEEKLSKEWEEYQLDTKKMLFGIQLILKKDLERATIQLLLTYHEMKSNQRDTQGIEIILQQALLEYYQGFNQKQFVSSTPNLEKAKSISSLVGTVFNHEKIFEPFFQKIRPFFSNLVEFVVTKTENSKVIPDLYEINQNFISPSNTNFQLFGSPQILNSKKSLFQKRKSCFINLLKRSFI
ncbi:ubiquitin carboxyl-terminal hydrolase 25 [Anaeramoeba ignava]|uniref:Ubiquitin carboxyl-terminal hydrolase n=1 Tax=Anaeramoeba ignava TaxID=1746090 RepID=A0A9Q0LUJ3_ANAIG|nr:ubiquitin carboxyl-terminal hydrolase 25 [Anaeramoeba ignava]